MSGEITNKCMTPYGSKASTYVWNVTRTALENGKYSYVVPDSASNYQGTFAFKMGVDALAVGDMLICVFSCEKPELLTVPRGPSNPRISCTDTTEGAVVSDTMGWVAGHVTATTGSHELWIVRECGPVTLEGCAAFSPDDWPRVRELLDDQKLRMAWFAPPTTAATGERTPPVLIP